MTEDRKLNRRTAVQWMGALAAASWAGVARPAGRRHPPAGREFAPVTPGVQLYTVRAEMQKSVERTLARVAEIGYREVEFAGYFDKKPAEIAALLKANGLAAPAAHVERAALGDPWHRVLDAAVAAGHQWVVIAWVPEGDRGSVQSYQRLAKELNQRAAAAKSRGLSFAYHNHDFEFTPLEGTNGHAVLMRECDPALVQFELDLYWITRAGGAAAEYVQRHPGRFPLVHVKDMAAGGAMVEVGSGTIPFQRIFDAARGGIRHFFVEHDNPASPFDSIARSFNTLRTLNR
jgi:sugar phosphate isomerase/epimerase